MNELLPELLDATKLQADLGVTRAAADAIMCRVPVVQIEDLRKVYVRRSDVCAYLNTRTFSKSEVPAQLGHSRKSLTLDAYSHVLVGD